MKAPIIFLLCGSLCACTTVTVTAPSTTTERVGQVPALNEASSATVGSTMFSQYRYWSKVGYRISTPVEARIMLGRVQVDAGDFVAPAQADNAPAYCTEKNSYIDPMVGRIKPACFVDSSNTGFFDTVKAAPGMIWFSAKLDQPVRYEKSEQVFPRSDAQKFELLYQGYAAQAVKISYREYVNDFARPAFFQDVSYEVSNFPTEVTFRSVRIQLLSADNNGIKYKVLSSF